MTDQGPFVVRPIGHVESALVDRATAPKQAGEGAPQAWLAFDGAIAAGVNDLRPGDEILVLTWLHQARRDVLSVHPRDDLAAPEKGVFATRSADRPNPIGIHRTRIVAVDGTRIHVAELEAADGIPIIDVKPALDRFDR